MEKHQKIITYILTIGILVLLALVYSIQSNYSAAQKTQGEQIKILTDQLNSKTEVTSQSKTTVNSTASAFDLQMLKSQCSERAESYFNSGRPLTTGRAISSNYTSHYNSFMGSCYIQITSTTPDYFAVELADANEGSLVGLFTADYNQQNAEIGNIRTCMITGIEGTCTSFEQFSVRARVYMSK